MSFNNEFITQSMNNMALKLAILIFTPLIILTPFALLVSKYCNNNFIKQIFSLFAVGVYLYWFWIFFSINFQQ
ncbi:hypothetical protein U3450_003897 [Bacillus cytotoxicus]|nr:hypothetical protein [Bacillus cytotoxicus]